MNSAPTATKLLSGLWLFSELDQREINDLSRLARRCTFEPDSTIVRQGERSDDFYVVAEGLLQVSVHDESGREITLRLMRHGDMFGELAALDGKIRSATITTLSVCTLFVFLGSDLLAMLRHSPDTSIKLLRSLAGLVRRLTERAEDLSFLAIPARLAKTMLEIADFCGTPLGPNQVALPIKLSQQDLAAHVQATRESVNKCLAVWIREGIVHRGGSQLVILDRRRLEELTHGHGQS